MLKVDALPAATQRVFQALASDPLTRGFLLIGGTALALHLGHRLSNDLDFIFCEANGQLPTFAIDDLIRKLQAQGHKADLVTDPAQASSFRINTGERLSDYARDYAIDGVKVTFFAVHPKKQPKRFAFWRTAQRAVHDACQFAVLAVESAKIAKTLVLQDRVRSRDLFDLMLLMRDQNYTMPAFFDTIARHADGATDGEEERLIFRGLMPLDRLDEGLQSVQVQIKILNP